MLSNAQNNQASIFRNQNTTNSSMLTFMSDTNRSKKLMHVFNMPVSICSKFPNFHIQNDF